MKCTKSNSPRTPKISSIYQKNNKDETIGPKTPLDQIIIEDQFQTRHSPPNKKLQNQLRNDYLKQIEEKRIVI